MGKKIKRGVLSKKSVKTLSKLERFRKGTERDVSKTVGKVTILTARVNHECQASITNNT